MKKRLLFGILFLFLISNVIAGTHDGSVTIVNFGTYSMTLQEASNFSYLKNDSTWPTSSYTSLLSGISHNPNNIYISVKGVDTTLQQAINNRALCGSGSSTYSQPIINGHKGEEITLFVDGSQTTLQAAINSGKFCCTPVNGGWSTYTWTVCSGTSPSCTQTGTRTCTNPVSYCGGLTCSGSATTTQSCTGGNCVAPAPDCRYSITSPYSYVMYKSYCSGDTFPPCRVYPYNANLYTLVFNGVNIGAGPSSSITSGGYRYYLSGSVRTTRDLDYTEGMALFDYYTICRESV